MAAVDRVKYMHAFLNDTRTQVIVSLLRKRNNISGLLKEASIRGVDRSTLCYHLNVLEEVGLISSKYVILEAPHSKGRAGRFYEVDHKHLDKALKAIKEMTRRVSAEESS